MNDNEEVIRVTLRQLPSIKNPTNNLTITPNTERNVLSNQTTNFVHSDDVFFNIHNWDFSYLSEKVFQELALPQEQLIEPKKGDLFLISATNNIFQKHSNDWVNITSHRSRQISMDNDV